MKTCVPIRPSRPSAPTQALHGILLLDDHSLVRDGLSELLAVRNDLRIVASTATPAEAIDAARKHKPDIAIVDLSLPDSNGVEVVKQLKSELPNLAVLVISMHDEMVYAAQALRAGAGGYVMKKEPSEKIFQAIDAVLKGETYLSEAFKREMPDRITGRSSRRTEANLDRLSERERQVFGMLGDGLATREIAARLELSVKTIETYRENLKTKLHLENGPALIQRAVQWSRSHVSGV